MRSELRMVVALGLAVAAWLCVVPTASSTGTSCGIPMLQTGVADSSDSGREADCTQRNDTRVLQGAVTALGSLAVLGGGAALAARRRAEKGKPWVAPPTSHWEDA